MKVLKHTEQRNVLVDEGMYNGEKRDELKGRYYIFLDDESNMRLSLSYASEIKVAYNKEYEFYHTVCVMENGDVVNVLL